MAQGEPGGREEGEARRAIGEKGEARRAQTLAYSPAGEERSLKRRTQEQALTATRRAAFEAAFVGP